MRKVQIGFWDVDSITKFIDLVNRVEYEVDLACGSCVVDAKSLLAVLGMRTAREMELIIHSDECGDLLSAIDVYLEQGKLVNPKKAIC